MDIMRSSNHWAHAQASDGYAFPTRLAKSSEDYLRALGRGWWFILLCMLAAGGAGTWFTLQQQPVYFASARVLIEPPRAILPDLVSEKTGNSASMNFFNTRVQMIPSREILRRVLSSKTLADWKERTGISDPLSHLVDWVEAKPVLNSNLVDVMLEGTDADVTAQMVNLVVDEFIRYEENSLREFEQLSRGKIESEMRNLRNELETKQRELSDFHSEHNNFLATGQSVEAARLEELEKAKTIAELKFDETKRKVEQFEALRKADVPFFSPETVMKSESIRAQVRQLDSELAAQREAIKPEWYEADPVIRRLRNRRDELMRSMTGFGKGDAEIELARLRQENQFAAMDLDKIKAEVDAQRKVVQGQFSDTERLSDLRTDHERLASLSGQMAINQIQVDMHQSLVTPRIQVIDNASTPTEPVRPIKEIQIPACFLAGMLLGGMIVAGVEFLNQRVRRSEQAATCLGLPLLGAIPRLKRRERMNWDGTYKLVSQQPGSRVNEAFRNIRTGLMGAEGEEKIRSLVVSSPTSGEGKSTVAANLAAACALAGENVLLVDMDLRHPRLGSAMGIPNASDGLVEAVSGRIHWNDAIRTTKTPNLFVLPAGDTAGVPLDILGTVEMHDLLAELADDFDRVILDGPPLLGLADARVVSRFADGMLLVVEASIHRAAPLGRVRQLCDHEGLRPVGFIFNGIRYKHDDLRSIATTVRRSRSRRAAAATHREESIPVDVSAAHEDAA
jgi:capsular exopolysaccharide synthesis family protein